MLYFNCIIHFSKLRYFVLSSGFSQSLAAHHCEAHPSRVYERGDGIGRNGSFIDAPTPRVRKGTTLTTRSIAVVIASFNRRAMTLRCLEQVFAEANGFSLSAYVFDDNSPDGTADAVRERYPKAKVLRGDGNFFWVRGMATAFGAALAADHDLYLWVIDDVILLPGFLNQLVNTLDEKTAQTGKPTIVVGTCCSAKSGEVTYGGMRRIPSPYALRVQTMPSKNVAQSCDTFHGNCALISRAATRAVGNIDAAFFSNHGDTDYGLRATAAGCDIWVAPGIAGTCEPNEWKAHDDQLLRLGPLRDRWRLLLRKPKYFHFPSWIRLTRRHVRPFWPIAALIPLRHLLPP